MIIHISAAHITAHTRGASTTPRTENCERRTKN